jgi:hypothetical protein
MLRLTYLIVFKLTAIYSFGSILVNEQFNSLPNYFDYYYDYDGEYINILLEQFNSEPEYFNVFNQRSTYGENPTLFTNINNGIMSFITDGSSEDMLQLSYPINSGDTSTGIIYFTVEAGNSAVVIDGGIGQGGEALNQAVTWLEFDDFSDDGEIDGEIALQNHNGVKRIVYGNDNYLEVSSFDKIYLRLSYDFNANLIKQYYSNDGTNFIELYSMYAYNIGDNFSITLGVESDYTEFNNGEVYFDNFVISASSEYNLNSATNLAVNAANEVLNIIGGSGPGEKEFQLQYPVNSTMTDTGSLHFTVLASNTASVTDGGTSIDDDGDINPFYEAMCGIGYSGFNGSTSVELINANGTKSIKYHDPNAPDEDGFINVSNLENIYLRTSYNFNTSMATSFYSSDGTNFIQLSSNYYPNDYFIVELAAETRNYDLEVGEIYFDNFVIADDTTYDYTLSDNPYNGSNPSNSSIILKTYKSNDMQTWELIETKVIQSETPLFLKSEIVTE